uniref:Uncharacterized protein n=1 Tax=Acrobeloides nanus TaxID=290746 RepID=A0A914DSD8_9BILA
MFNIARIGAPTDVHMVSTIDNKFSDDFIKRVRPYADKYFDKEYEKMVIIVRRFESEMSYKWPNNISELFESYSYGRSVEFHKFVWAIGHSIPGLNEWFYQSLKNEATNLTKVQYLGPFWEPQILARRNDPYHYEKQPIGCADQQVFTYLFCRAEYEFYVISHAFSTHPVAERIRNAKGHNFLSLCTNGDLRYSFYVFNQSVTWEDYISVAFFIDANSYEDIQQYITDYYCEQNMRNKVSTHLVWKQSSNTSECLTMPFPVNNFTLNKNCTKTGPYVQSHSKNKNWTTDYPQNAMFNIARIGAPTDVHMVSTIDNKFSDDFIRRVRPYADKYLDKEYEKMVIIVRRFESEMSYKWPNNISELFESYTNGRSVEFHKFVWAIGHSIPGLNEWFYQSLKDKATNLTKIKYLGPFWEPQILVRRNDPHHYEKQPIGCADQQVFTYVFCRAEYEFYVLSHAFSTHPGILKKPTDRITNCSALKTEGPKFFHLMNKMFPKTKVTCGKITNEENIGLNS